MPSIGDNLQVFGLSPGATWKQINEAYRDLISVWHPDRFQNNERLRTKAEEQTRAINAAMDELRKTYKEGAASPHSQSARPQSTRPQQTTANRPKGSAHNTSTQSSGFSSENARYRHQHQRDVRNAAYQFELAPLVVYQRATASLSRLFFSAIVVVLATIITQEPNASAERTAAVSAFLIVGLHFFTLNTVLLLTRRPIVIVSSYGLSSFRTGFIRIRDIKRMWSCIEAGVPALAVKYSPEFVKRQNLLTRALFGLRDLVGRADCVIRCGAFDTHPIVIVNRISMQQLEYPAESTPVPPLRAQRRIWWGQTICLCSAAALCLRPLMGLSTTASELAIYSGVFVTTDLVTIMQRLLLVRK